MDKRNTERIEDLPTVETPEDVAVLYSWANLHGAKYRDFSASRREYRAQLRHRAAEQARDMELRAQASAETAASLAEDAAREAEETAMSNQARDTEFAHQQALLEAEEAARVATAERMEAARRAEAAALAEAAARREQREIADAHASARRQAAQYAESESRRRREIAAEAQPQVPGEITDPYTPQSQMQPRQLPNAQPGSGSAIPVERQAVSYRSSPSSLPQPPSSTSRDLASVEYAAPPQEVSAGAPAPQAPARRPQGYRPDDASGVRQIYRGPEFESKRETGRQPSTRQLVPPDPAPETKPASSRPAPTRPAHEEEPHVQPDDFIGLAQRSWKESQPPARPAHDRASAWSDGLPSLAAPEPAPGMLRRIEGSASTLPPAYNSAGQRSSSEAAMEESLQDPTPRRRRQDQPGYKQEHPSESGSGPSRRRSDLLGYSAAPPAVAPPSGRRPLPPVEEPRIVSPVAPEPSTPAWLYASVPQQPKAAPAPPAAPQTSVAETLQHSRERVAARWYALKGVFDQPGQERPEPAPVRQKETRTPILAVFSMAGGVGKTSLVATLGRSLSSLGEKVLLTDTTSHGLLPFYFGASELRQGSVRTFSPPSGSTDAPIYLVSYDVDDRAGDEAAQDALIEEITASSRGTHRVLLDLSVGSGWIARRMARLSPTILVPVAPDMNSVISLQMVERFFQGVLDAEGRPLKVLYLLNQFDASLPLHLDIREVLRRQLGDRLLPFVIRRAPAVGEALAEGMTIIDYASDAPVAEDYLNAATWLRTVAAPATAGFRNVRWSER